jgi:hypothetical protein
MHLDEVIVESKVIVTHSGMSYEVELDVIPVDCIVDG